MSKGVWKKKIAKYEYKGLKCQFCGKIFDSKISYQIFLTGQKAKKL